MGKSVVILEDTAARVVEMKKVLDVLLPSVAIVTFDNAPDFIDWLATGLRDAVLICLDHDLGPTRERGGGRFDPGIGRDVVEAMALYPPVCPVIVHSSNYLAVPGMLRVLRESGWRCSAVMPADDLSWIPSFWREEIERYLNNGWIK